MSQPGGVSNREPPLHISTGLDAQLAQLTLHFYALALVADAKDARAKLHTERRLSSTVPVIRETEEEGRLADCRVADNHVLEDADERQQQAQVEEPAQLECRGLLRLLLSISDPLVPCQLIHPGSEHPSPGGRRGVCALRCAC